jgi:hypothetical protein
MTADKKETMTVYKSKQSPGLIIPVALIIGAVSVLLLQSEQSWTGFLIMLPVIAFIVHMFLATKYTIAGTLLNIRCGLMYHKQIDINTVRKIAETNNPLSAPAPSLDRLEISFGNYESVMISPRQKNEFISEMIAVNPNIEVCLKKK